MSHQSECDRPAPAPAETHADASAPKSPEPQATVDPHQAARTAAQQAQDAVVASQKSEGLV